jgi:hypothetical protein
MSWKTFLYAHWSGIAAADFFAVEVLTLRRLTRYFVFFVMELRTHRVRIAGIVHQPYAERFVRSIRNACLDHVVLVGEGHLRTVVHEYVAHYQPERKHQGIGNALIATAAVAFYRIGRTFLRQRGQAPCRLGLACAIAVIIGKARPLRRSYSWRIPPCGYSQERA